MSTLPLSSVGGAAAAIKLKNIPAALLEAIQHIEMWGLAFRCENLRALPYAASLERIEAAAQEDAEFALKVLDDIKSSVDNLSKQSGKYSDHRLRA